MEIGPPGRVTYSRTRYLNVFGAVTNQHWRNREFPETRYGSGESFEGPSFRAQFFTPYVGYAASSDLRFWSLVTVAGAGGGAGWPVSRLRRGLAIGF